MEPEVPIGALPEEVADKVDIKASEGEYILPADVVRYLGLDKIEKLVKQAKEGLVQMDQEGRVGGEEAPPATEVAAAPSEAVAGPTGAPVADPLSGSQQAFAEGGLVTPDYLAQAGFSGTKIFKDAKGRVMVVPVVNGQPAITLPEGFAETTQAESVAPAPQKATVSNPLEDTQEKAFKDRGELTGYQGAPEKWGVSEFEQYSSSLDNGVLNGFKDFVTGSLPMGNTISKAIGTHQQARISKTLDSMLETKVDAQGNPLSADQITSLQGVKDKLAGQPTQNIGAALAGDLIGAGGLVGAISRGFGAIKNAVTGGGQSAYGREGQSRADYDKEAEANGEGPNMSDRMDQAEEGMKMAKGGLIQRRKR